MTGFDDEYSQKNKITSIIDFVAGEHAKIEPIKSNTLHFNLNFINLGRAEAQNIKIKNVEIYNNESVIDLTDKTVKDLIIPELPVHHSFKCIFVYTLTDEIKNVLNETSNDSITVIQIILEYKNIFNQIYLKKFIIYVKEITKSVDLNIYYISNKDCSYDQLFI